MGLLALILSVVVDAIWPLRGRPQELPLDEVARDASTDDEAADPLAEAPYDPLLDAQPQPRSRAGARPAWDAGISTGFTAHPLLRHALRLIDAVAADDGATATVGGQRRVSMPGWLLVAGLPVLLVAVVEGVLGAAAGIFVFLLHVAVLYLTVGLGAFHRQFSELQLLVGAGEEASARTVLSRWMGAGGPAAVSVPVAHPAADRPLAATAAGHAILAAYRDVFAPLFWYLVLPGAIGPVLYLFARFAACHSYPFARTAYLWIDWIPLRLASLVFALVGRFEDTVFCLRAVTSIRPAVEDVAADPYLHQRLLLLPVASGALGLRLADAGVDASLRAHAPDLDLPGDEPEASSLRSVSGLLLRSGTVLLGIYLLVKLLG